MGCATAALVCGTLMAFLPVRAPVQSAETPAACPVRMSLIRSMFKDTPDPLIQIMTDVFKAPVEEQTGLAAKVSVSGDPQTLALQLKEGKLQVGAFHGFEMAWVREKNPDLKPLMICVKQQSFVRAVVVVHQDSKASDAAALQGKTFALPQLARQHVRLFLQRRCVRSGVEAGQVVRQDIDAAHRRGLR